MMYIGGYYLHTHSVQLVKASENATDWAAGAGASSVHCASSLGAQTGTADSPT